MSALGSILKKIFGTKHERAIRHMLPVVEKINKIEKEYQSLTDDQLKAKTTEFKERFKAGTSLDELLPEAFATVKNACRRLEGMELTVTGQQLKWAMVPYDVQLLGGMALHQGCVAEMQTGEGKTLVAILPLYLNALSGRNCQLVTVNDYLALRDSEWVGTVLRWLGLSVGCIEHDLSAEERRQQYACDVTYGTNSEFGFDYLRDMGMAASTEDIVQRDYYFAIVDEVDSILIDEARTPLIIAGPTPTSTHRYDQLKPAVENLVRKQSQHCTELIAQAKTVLIDSTEATSTSEEELDKAITKAFLVKLGMPKHKQLMRLLEEPKVVRLLEKKEMDARSDQNRGVFHELKETLYFSIDERAGEADLSEMGRTAIAPHDPDTFTLPDLVSAFQIIDERQDLTDEQRQQERIKLQRLFDERSEMIHNISQLLRAYCLFEADVQYVVQDNKVIIVDENTGRMMHGRRFSEGLHQALEAKEGVTIERETQTLATITIQNYFRLYEKLAGMTGTAETEANELRDIYDIDVLVIPTNKPCIRQDSNDRIFKTKREKYAALVNEIKELHAQGQPVLIGTISVEVSEVLSRFLRREKIAHNVLNAKHHQREAEIVSLAGQRGTVTIATNMAGRGTDIRLGSEVDRIGGLHVIGSERHDSRRIDRQLRGRCARQGDPGSSRFYISLEDDLMRLFGSDRIASLMDKLGFQEGEELSHPLLNRSIEGAQKKVEQQHYMTRKRTLQFDDVVNKQRQVIYGRRRDILTSENTTEMLFNFIDDAVYNRLETSRLDFKKHGAHFDQLALLQWLTATFPITFTEADTAVDSHTFDADQLVTSLTAKIKSAYEAKIKGEDPDLIRRQERYIMLSAHDKLWQEHLYGMDELRSGVYLVSYGQRDPLVEYKQSAFQMFGELIERISNEIATTLFRSASNITALHKLLVSLPKMEIHRMLGQFGGEAQNPVLQTTNTDDGMAVPVATSENPQDREASQPAPLPKGITIHREQPKVGRNDHCPCGSGQKYKKCCGTHES